MPDAPSEPSPEEFAVIEHMAAVGQVASMWALFETLLDSLALENAGIDREAGYCFTAQVAGWARKLDAYIAVARLFGAGRSAGEPLETLGQAAGRLSERRNRVVHDPWSFEPGQAPHRLEVSARRKLRVQMVETSTVEILQLLDDIRAHIEKFIALDAAIKAALATAREKPK